MAPKKKGGKKQADEWEADLGETIDPVAQATADAKTAEAEQDAAEEQMNGGGGGGLLAALRKNKDKRAKKGKPVINDFVDGEDPNGAVPSPSATDLDAKAPAEATFADDGDDDVFAGNAKKGKGGKKQQETPAAEDEEDAEEGGVVKSKKEKEREKKEREKQRKKEQVSH